MIEAVNYADIEVVKGDSYTGAVPRLIEWLDESDQWTGTDFTGATITLDASVFTATVTYDDGRKLSAPLTKENTALLVATPQKYTVKATLATGEIITLVYGNFVVKAI